MVNVLATKEMFVVLTGLVEELLLASSSPLHPDNNAKHIDALSALNLPILCFIFWFS
jgi:hypothetical protein